MTAEAIARIRREIRHAAALASSTPLFVALDGHSGAGKSTIAAELAQNAEVCVVGGDDFYRVMPLADRLALTAQDGADQYIDWQRLRAEALTPLREGRAATYRPYDWSDDRLAMVTVTVRPAPIVIVEGVYSARPELADLISLCVLVDAPLEVRQARLAARGEPDDVWDARWQAAEEVYFSTVRPRDTFDLIVST
jgi:uridine kinase